MDYFRTSCRRLRRHWDEHQVTRTRDPATPPPAPAVVIHGHYYQPPRENPWLEEIEAEPTAAPYHDWNQRIETESYRAVTAARLPGPTGRIAEIINTLAWSSFNFGPTLFTWLEREAPDTYQAILEADRESIARLGHGNAIAHPYHHAILPLSTRRDKVTEVRWGIRDFTRRFGREPEGMWLPETAVDEETLDVLAEQGIRFTVLAPHQAQPLPPHGLPGLYRTPGGREIALFFYDGDLSHGVAFGELIRDARRWISRLGDAPGIVAIATDGETYGHHHTFGEMALARVIHELRSPAPENFATVLARHPAIHPVTLNAPSSWSCAHGVERWRSECGCRIAPHLPTRQLWRSVLRSSLDWLAGEIHAIYEREGAALFDDIWETRNRYDPGGEDAGASPRGRELMELERHALLVYTSCAWFFDDLAGIEPVQVLKYAARAIELAGPDGTRIEAEFLRRLAEARSNDPREGDGRQIYLARAKPAIAPEIRHAAGLALLGSLSLDPALGQARAFTAVVSRAGEGAWDIELRHRRTSREHRFRVGLLETEIEVTLAENAMASPLAWRLNATDLWDRHRQLAGQARRRQLVEEVLTDDQRQALASGDTDLPAAVRRALVSAIGAMETRGTSPVFRALELLSVLELAIPFDAQTRFGERLAASRVPSAELAALAERLGFENPATTGHP